MHFGGLCQSTNPCVLWVLPIYLCVYISLYMGLAWEGAVAKGEGVNGVACSRGGVTTFLEVPLHCCGC